MNWNHMWTLIKFEVKHTHYYFLFLGAVVILLFFSIRSNFQLYTEHGNVSFDFLFLFLASLSFLFIRPKIFRYHKLDDLVWASQFLIILQQLPITKKFIITYRFMYHLVVVVPIQIVIFICLYLFTPPLQDLLTIGEYFTFTVIWLCIGVLIYWVQMFQDTGIVQTFGAVVERILLSLFMAVIILVLFYSFYKKGVVHWTIFTATNYPILSMICALSFATGGTIILKKRAEQKMSQFDYY